MSKLKLFAITCMALLSLSSCRKVYDYIREHPDAYQPPCRVTNFRVLSVNGAHSNFVISYNGKGNPISIMDSDRVNPMGWDQYFRYDRYDRLTDYIICGPPSTSAMIWHKYAYIRPDLIADTSIGYTGEIDQPAPLAKDAVSYHIRTFNMDRLGRIAITTYLSYDPPHTPYLIDTLKYDANGNLPIPDWTGVYDDKVNILRTNKVWEFVNINYSRNNLLINDGAFPTRYNEYGLPLNLRNQARFLMYPFRVENYDQEAFVTYACSLPKGPIDY